MNLEQSSSRSKSCCCNINWEHLKVIMLKDRLILKRRRVCLFSLVFLPPLFFFLATLSYILIDTNKYSGPLMNDNFYYSTNKYQMVPLKDPPITIPFPASYLEGSKNMPKSASNIDGSQFGNIPFTSFFGCYTQQNGDAQNKFAIISSDADVREKATTFFEKYVFVTSGLNVYHQAIYSDQPAPEVISYSSKQELLDILSTQKNYDYCAAVNFEKLDTANFDYQVELSVPGSATPDTNKPIYNELVRLPNLDDWSKTLSGSSAALYPYVTEFIARYQKDKPMDDLTTFVGIEVGYSPYSTLPVYDINAQTTDSFMNTIASEILYAYLIIFIYIANELAGERESKSREGMKMMGLKDGTYYAGWFILFTVFAVWNALTGTIIFCSTVLSNINPLLVFIFLILYGFALFGQAWIIVAILPTTRGANLLVLLFQIITFSLGQTFNNGIPDKGTVMGLSFLPNVAMDQLIKQLVFYNFQTGDGLRLGGNSSFLYENYSFTAGMLFLAADAIIYTLLGIYLDQVLPSDYGVPKPWNFCLKCKKSRRVLTADMQPLNEVDDEMSLVSDPRNFEPVADALKRQESSGQCLKVRGLVKKFGEKTAVNGTNLTMYKGQIFALLGHNGAGKTTTLSMLTGLLKPTSGKAEVFGIDVFEDMDQIRQILGVCPQHDVLFRNLTPEEHLRIYAAFKGSRPREIEIQVHQMLLDIDLIDQKDQQARTLSGGQKRKLSVAISMIGNSKIVMLDEPTSGMDTTARRRLWDMLKKNKGEKIVILTTHYMDEADILGDRIAIMSEGDVQCTGSSLFLKKRYGVGYNLVIAKKVRNPLPEVDKFIMERLPNAVKLQEVSSEITYQLPQDSSSGFKQFFNDFDQNLEQLQLRSYSVGVTTLEEVFLKIGHGEEVEKAREEGGMNLKAQGEKLMTVRPEDQDLEEYSIAKDPNGATFFDQLKNLSTKKLKTQIRDRNILIIELMFPIIILLAMFAFSKVKIIKNYPPQTLSVFEYPQQNMYYVESNWPESNLAQNMTPNEFFMNNIYCGQDACNQSHWQQLIKVADPDPSLATQNSTDYFIAFDKSVGEAVLDHGTDWTYGSILVNHIGSNNTDPESWRLSDNYNAGDGQYSLMLFLNSTSGDVSSFWSAFAHQLVLKEFLKNEANTAGKVTNFQMVLAPFPLSNQVNSFLSVFEGLFVVFGIGIAYILISMSMMSNIVKEKELNLKNQMRISGVSLPAYWIGLYVSDVIFGAISTITMIILLYVYDIDCPKGPVLLIVNTFANPIFIYFYSCFFTQQNLARQAVLFLYLLVAIILPLVIAFLQIINDTTKLVGEILKWCFMPIPVFSTCLGVYNIILRKFLTLIYFTDGTLDIPPQDFYTPNDRFTNNNLADGLKPFDKLIAGWMLLFLFFAIIFYWIMLWLIESRILSFCVRSIFGGGERDQVERAARQSIVVQQDEDIVEEERRVNQLNPDNLPVRMNLVSKVYGDVTAVKKVSFGLEFGECFALLGVSGAGKTTLFKCMTGEVYPSTGELTINGFDVTTPSGFQQARKCIGYCPQFDCIFEGLTVYEHLKIYASLKGIKQELRERIIQKQINDMDLRDYVNVKANQLSGGNKRKLSVSMAMLGNPPLIFLDEPSTGVDPQAKRFMWNIVAKISTQRKQSGVIITTHSMEEAEALCTKMGIMVKGEFKCFGPSTHIKDKFGTGYEIEFKIRMLKEDETDQMVKQAMQNGLMAPLNIANCKQYLENNGKGDLAAELAQDGQGNDFVELERRGLQINPHEFIRWVFTETMGNMMIDMLENKFSECTIVEHYNNSWKIKTSRDNYSIGFLFGMMEEQKDQFQVSEYQVSQTTLEQIFNNFARMGEQTNPMNRKYSLKRRSTAGKSLAGQITPADPSKFDLKAQPGELNVASPKNMYNIAPSTITSVASGAVMNTGENEITEGQEV